MLPLKDIKINYDLNVQDISGRIKYLKNRNIDFNVYLPSIGRNLQRDLVWTIEQKRELIWSLLMGRHIPPLSIINAIDPTNENEDILLIIDGKQRLTTIFDFIDDKFTLVYDNNEYLYSELPKEYQLEIYHHDIKYFVVNEPYELKNRITDKQKIDWFKSINFAGTPQELEHLKSLKIID